MSQEKDASADYTAGGALGRVRLEVVTGFDGIAALQPDYDRLVTLAGDGLDLSSD